MTRLSVNLNKVATLRNTRHLGIPSVLTAALACIKAGAHGITLHPRPDERHIRAHDVFEVAELLQDFPHVELNLEGNPLHNLLGFVERVRPCQCTFVPDSAGQFTSDHGWCLPQDEARLLPLVRQAQDAGARVSLFMDADAGLVRLAAACGVQRVELYTEPWARGFAALFSDSSAAAPRARKAFDEVCSLAESLPFAQAARAAQEVGLGVNAGHDLNRDNLLPFLRAVPGVLEVSIGHALIADALELGYAQAVQAYLAVLREVGAEASSVEGA